MPLLLRGKTRQVHEVLLPFFPFTATSRCCQCARAYTCTLLRTASHAGPPRDSLHCPTPLLPIMNPTLPCNSNAKRPPLPMPPPPPPTEQQKAAASHTLRFLPHRPNATIYPHLRLQEFPQPPSVVLPREPHWPHHYVCVLVKSAMNKTHSSSIDSVRRERPPLPSFLLQLSNYIPTET